MLEISFLDKERMFQFFQAWRRRRILQRFPVADTLWQYAVAHLPALQGLSTDERTRLRQWVTLFLREKSINGAGGLVLTDHMRVMIATQACLPILNLDLDYYAGWEEIIVYPAEFEPEYDVTDEYGVVHHTRHTLSGEAWLGGPVVLSWLDAENLHTPPGHNVVIHEFAHKLDMLNGSANGYPPLHADMQRETWSTVFQNAFDTIHQQINAGIDPPINTYAAETPGEFFAVLSEAFFETPQTVKLHYPAVYTQLSLYYRQDPAQRRL